jgi:peroxiredoxin
LPSTWFEKRIRHHRAKYDEDMYPSIGQVLMISIASQLPFSAKIFSSCNSNERITLISFCQTHFEEDIGISYQNVVKTAGISQK